MVKQYLFGGPHDGKIVECSASTAALPILTVSNYTRFAAPTSLEDYELWPMARKDRRYWLQSRPYPMPGIAAAPKLAGGSDE